MIPSGRRILGALVLLVLMLGQAPAANAVVAADTSDFVFDSFDATYHLSLNGKRADLRVVETLSGGGGWGGGGGGR